MNLSQNNSSHDVRRHQDSKKQPMLLKLAKNIFSSVTSTKPLPVLDAVDRHKSLVVNEHLLYKVLLIPVNCSFGGFVSETPDKKFL
jgi:hypothetical protein